MDEFEKKLEYQAQKKVREADYDENPRSIFLDGFASGKKWMAEDILKQYRSMTCKMIEKPLHEYEGYPTVECSACRLTFMDVHHFLYCPNCGRKVDNG